MFKPANMSLWQGRTDNEESLPALRWHQVIKDWNERSDLAHAPVLLGFACDEGVKRNQGRPGAKMGPDALRKALSNLAYWRDQSPWDCGNIECNDEQLETAQQALAEYVAKLLNMNGRPVILGGGHEMAWGSFLGLRRYLDQTNPTARIGIINFDSHFDLRNPQPRATSGTAFRQIAEYCTQQQQPFNYFAIGINATANTAPLFQYAMSHKVGWRMDIDCASDGFRETERALSTFLERVDELYVSVCLDVLPAHICPGVSAPAALGVDPHMIIKLINLLKNLCSLQHVQWRLSDVAELNPLFDQDERSAKIAARLVHELTE